jgi:hypothetical protein
MRIRTILGVAGLKEEAFWETAVTVVSDAIPRQNADLKVIIVFIFLLHRDHRENTEAHRAN